MARETKPEPKRGRGRPDTYTDEIAAAICERIAKGDRLTAICEEPAFPKYKTVDSWQQRRAKFAGAIARAREGSRRAH